GAPAIRRGLAAGEDRIGGERLAVLSAAVLVAGEIALALVLLAGAGLMIKSFSELGRAEPGFDPHNLLDPGLSGAAQQVSERRPADPLSSSSSGEHPNRARRSGGNLGACGAAGRQLEQLRVPPRRPARASRGRAPESLSEPRRPGFPFDDAHPVLQGRCSATTTNSIRRA